MVRRIEIENLFINSESRVPFTAANPHNLIAINTLLVFFFLFLFIGRPIYHTYIQSETYLKGKIEIN